MSPVRIQTAASPSMKLHHFARGFREHEPTSLTLAGCKRLRPLAPAPAPAAFDLKSFIRPESGPRKHGSSDYQNTESTQVEVAAGGTRWNPTQEQIRILEMLYGGGMRTPNAQQIEQITAQLAKYGKIEGKNVFYWFQNHKARERQKQKRTSLGLSPSPSPSPSPQPPPSPFTLLSSGEESDSSSQKRKLRSWCAEVDYRYCEEEGEGNRTLELFPLHPEGRRSS